MNNYKEMIFPLLKELCKIPAPSHFEEERAEFCKKYLMDMGYDKVWIDEAKNVLCEINCDNSEEITVFCAHTDTVFPDMEPMPFYEKDGKAFCPGIGDDTASLAIMLISAKYLKDNNLIPEKGMVFVCNSCEEGLGNLKGTRAVMERYKGRVASFVSFDAGLDHMYTRCVGSHRYSVQVETEGGHSFGSFGNKNAIHRLAGIINEIYKINVPKKEGCRTTYNVGTIEGGTSVNTIAQSAKMLCEYRSDDVECLEYMQKEFERIFKDAEKDGVIVKVTKVGDRPCEKDVDPGKLNNLIEKCTCAIEKNTGQKVSLVSGSTDCNIPMSMGVPAVALGVYIGGKCHTREEWIEIESLDTGFDVAIDVIKAFL